MFACPDDPRRQRGISPIRGVVGASRLVLMALACAGCSTDLEGRARWTGAAAAAADGVHRLVRFNGVVQPAQRRALVDQGVRLLVRRGEGWWVAHGPEDAFADLGGAAAQVRAQQPAEKLGPNLRRAGQVAAGAPPELRVLLSSASGPRGVAALKGIDPGARRVGSAPVYSLRGLDPDLLLDLASVDAVRYVEVAPGPAIPQLAESRAAIGVEALQAADTSKAPPTYALGGKGTAAGIWDPHGVEPTHEDLKANLVRYADTKTPASLSHGTAVGGCLAGSGARSSVPGKHPWDPYHLRGMAPQAKLAMYITSGEKDAAGKATTFHDQYLQARNTFAVDVLSFSFSHSMKATYDSTAANLDFIIARSNAALPEAVPIAIASTNDGAKYGYGSVSSMASAKNTLTVGATDWVDGEMVSFSGFGPTVDLRMKPEVMAPGCSSHGKTLIGIDKVRVIPTAGSAKTWTFDSGVEGWSIVRHLDKLVHKSGAIEARTTGHDPGVYSPAKLGLDPKIFTKVEITMRADRHHRAELFWKTDKGGFHWSRARRFFINGDGKLHTYTVDLSGHDSWKDTIDQIRVDPITTGIALTAPGNTYNTTCGTSMSTPIAAGGVLLMVQAWRAALPAAGRPSPAMIKAILVATARDMIGVGSAKNPDLNGAKTPYPQGPDHATGFGEVRIDRAAALIRLAGKGNKGFVEGVVPYTGRKVNMRLRFKQAPAAAFSVTMAWDDPPGEPGSKSALQNDLDLTVKTPSGKVLLPWLLDAAKPEKAAVRGADRVNNLEQVPVLAGELHAGDYLISVRGEELARGSQRFAVALSGAAGTESLVLDADGDGAFEGDCDDGDPGINPSATEIPGNGKDDDCDPKTLDSPVADAAAPAPDASTADGSLQASGDAASPAGEGCSCHVAPASGGGRPVLLLLIACLLAARRFHTRQ